ncbi:hypothetical protein F4818DRAFT_453453 [Hypoxylon cercidicola]|nr:hypothetical protein F4818DRAFT_453453 [Hypoxylon cercidicola]
MRRLKRLIKRSSGHASGSGSQSPATSVTEWPQGLDIVYDCPEASLDIVAIHGLNGHREKTWTADNGVHWLRTLLPKDLPNVRIVTWGYDANTHSRDRMNCQYLYDHALELVADLTRMRTLTNSTERPIIFVAHSLGGIVVKSALIHSDAARQGALYEHRSVKTSTYGIIFMGTPHQGGNGVQLGRALVNIASIFIAADDHILRHLERDSEWLQQQMGQYGPISGEFVTKFAYETKPTPVLLGGTMLVVPRSSAVVPGQADAEPIGIHSDHIHMVKFSSEKDGGYIKVSENLQIMARSAGETIQSRWEAEVRADNARRDDITQFSLPLNLSQVTSAPRFVAREDEIRQMDGILRKGGGRQTAILHGLGGMGKTQLAREYIKRHQAHFSAAIWLNARDTTSLQQSYMQAAQRILRYHQSLVYVRNAVQNQDLDQCVEAVNQWLDEPANGNWVVVYDNYDNPKFGDTKATNTERGGGSADVMLADERNETVLLDQEAFDIRPFLPGTDHGAIIITTRSAAVDLGEYIRITKLADPKSSLEILASTSRRQEIDQDEAASRLAQRLDGLPLALTTAGAYLKGVPATTCAEYLTSYEKSWKQLLEKSPKILSYEDRALYSTWNISYAHIEDQNPASATLLRLWAYFDNEDLWYELLLEGLSRDGKEYLNGIVADKISFNEAIRVLYDHGLVEPEVSMKEPGGESNGYSMHGCVHSWTQHVLHDDQDEEGVYMAHLAMECVATHNPDEATAEYWLIQRRLLKHADRCFTRIDTTMQVREGDEWIYLNLGNLYNNERRFAEAKAMYEPVLQGYQKKQGYEYELTLIAFHNLGRLYSRQGQFDDAKVMYERALQGNEKMLGPEHISTLQTVHNLGVVYADQGRFAEAEAMYKRALQGNEKMLGPEHILTLQTVNNLGVMYKNQGRFAEAEAMYKRALQGNEKMLGPEHISTLQTVHNLGVVYTEQGRFAEAKALYNRALQGKEKILGSEHISTFDTVHNLGAVYTEQGRFAEAKALYNRALQGYKKILGPEHISTLGTVHNLGAVYAEQGRFAEAEALYNRALQGYEKAVGVEKAKVYPDAINTLENLGTLFHKLNDKEKSRMYYIRARDGYQAVYGSSSNHYVRVVSMIQRLQSEPSGQGVSGL